LILSGLTAKRAENVSAVAVIESFAKGRGFGSAEDVDAHLDEERKSWER